MTQPTKEELYHLADKWINGTITSQEKKILDTWYEQDFNEPLVWYGVDRSEKELSLRLLKNINKKRDRVKIRRVNWKWTSAAALLLIFIGVIFWYHSFEYQSNKKQAINVQVIKPGSSRAVLTLDNGEKIYLDSTIGGQVALQSGVRIVKSSDGSLLYETVNNSESDQATVSYNTIEVPSGGQWQVILPDGSHVWLNSQSKLKYPVKFIGSERKIELEGEGYFEVAKDKTMPFRVVTENQTIEVIGTHFNVNAYSDEKTTITTLIEGSVKVAHRKLSDAILLKPDQQTSLTDNGIKLTDVDPESAIAWKRGMFFLNDEPLEVIMRKIARWYDVEIVYKNVDKGLRFGGSVSRYDHIGKILTKLEFAGDIHFKIEGRRIIVMK
ncbi:MULTISPECIES: FecR family protein [unclassified Sphingobacterium]|uniref:FecR family protein n=1 Tax=unclassified Sphingobacterium TaxID=2609468 RepID=UPI001043898D|nr:MULTISPECIES: FecR family protein [unclassified Sphingobacterium]MCS3554215.1 ferric-dicitrate binding protein FerR (iron transport regulator) [Sphingobacterium sp. JUb21]TCR08048.1 FecR family protein [Sphingobacterium sp. JUb20]